MVGICAEEMEMDGSKLLGRKPANYVHLAEFDLSNQDTKLPSSNDQSSTVTANNAAEIALFKRRAS